MKPETVQSFLKKHGLTHKKAADITMQSVRQFQRYTAHGNVSTPIPYCVWYTLHHKITGKAPAGQ